MKLSRQSLPMLDITPFDRNTCKLVGEFAGNDVHLLRGEYYYVLHSGRNTFVKTVVNNRTYQAQLGENRHIHVFEVIRRTPCSYITDYKYTLIICHTRMCGIYKFRKIFSSLKGTTRRFFPNRKLDIQKYLLEYVILPFKVIPDEVFIRYAHRNFYLNITPGLNQYFNIYS